MAEQFIRLILTREQLAEVTDVFDPATATEAATFDGSINGQPIDVRVSADLDDEDAPAPVDETAEQFAERDAAATEQRIVVRARVDPDAGAPAEERDAYQPNSATHDLTAIRDEFGVPEFGKGEPLTPEEFAGVVHDWFAMDATAEPGQWGGDIARSEASGATVTVTTIAGQRFTVTVTPA